MWIEPTLMAAILMRAKSPNEDFRRDTMRSLRAKRLGKKGMREGLTGKSLPG